MRIIVTGSRTWTDVEAISLALRRYDMPGNVLVSGACPSGADAIAEGVARTLGWEVERHPADWSKGKGAGHARNRVMAELGADVCLAFNHNNSPGTTHMVNRCVDAGIPVSEQIRIDGRKR